MIATIFEIAIFICVFLAIFILLPSKKKKPTKVPMHCELCVRSIGDDVYKIEASWCDTKAKAVGTMQIGNPKDVSLGDLIEFIEAARALAEARGDISEED